MININELSASTRIIIHNYEEDNYTGYITAEVIEIKNGEIILADRVIKEDEFKNIETANEENLDRAYSNLFNCFRTQAEKLLRGKSYLELRAYEEVVKELLEKR